MGCVMTITKKPLVSLSSQGWITSLEHQADRMFAYFVTSEYSQSVLYYGSVRSLPWLVQKYGNDRTDFRREVKNALDNLFSFYDNVLTEVTLVEGDDDSNQFSVNVSCVLTYQSQEYSLARQLQIADNRVKKIIDISNGVYV